MSSFRVTWEPAPGEVKGYKVTFHPTGDDRRLGELVVGPYDNTVVLEELRYALITLVLQDRATYALRGLT